MDIIERSSPKLAILKHLTSVRVPGIKKFVVADAFGPNNLDGIKFHLEGDFIKHFLGKIEKDVKPTTIAIHRLERSSRDPEIMAKLGAKKRIISLAHSYELIKAQAQGQEGLLLVNRCANIAYIEEENETVWAAEASWDSDVCEWIVGASSVENSVKWAAGLQVLSQVWGLGSWVF